MSETIEDVVKSLRDRAEGRRKSGKLLQIDDKMFDLLADRIEAAHKREVAVAKMETTTPTCEKSSQVGNAAANHKALMEIQLICWKAGGAMGYAVACGIIKAKSRAALAAPPRNCDLFGGDPNKLHELWFEWSGDPKNCNADGTVKFTFGEWLLMPANAKGANDE